MGQYTSHAVLVKGEWEFGVQCHPTEMGCGVKKKV